MAIIDKLSNGRNEAIKFVDDYGSMIPEGKREVAGEELETEPSKTKTERKSPIEFINEIKNDEKNTNEQIIKGCFFYQTP